MTTGSAFSRHDDQMRHLPPMMDPSCTGFIPPVEPILRGHFHVRDRIRSDPRRVVARCQSCWMLTLEARQQRGAIHIVLRMLMQPVPPPHSHVAHTARRSGPSLCALAARHTRSPTLLSPSPLARESRTFRDDSGASMVIRTIAFATQTCQLNSHCCTKRDALSA